MPLRRALFALIAAACLALAAPIARAQPADPSFNLVNRSGQPIAEIYVSPVSEPFWGRNLLAGEILPDARFFPVRLPPQLGFRQDIRVVFTDGRTEERRGLDTCAIAELVFGAPGATPPPASRTGNPSFNLVNHGAMPMREIYVSSAREATWGATRIAQPLEPGRHLPVRLPVDDCVNDIRVVWMDGRIEDRRRVDTCGLVNLVFP